MDQPDTHRMLDRILDNSERSISMLREHDARLARLEESDKDHARMEAFFEESRSDRARMNVKLEAIGVKLDQFGKDLGGFDNRLESFERTIQEFSLDRARLSGGWKTFGLIAGVLTFTAGAVTVFVKLLEWAASVGLTKKP